MNRGTCFNLEPSPGQSAAVRTTIAPGAAFCGDAMMLRRALCFGLLSRETRSVGAGWASCRILRPSLTFDDGPASLAIGADRRNWLGRQGDFRDLSQCIVASAEHLRNQARYVIGGCQRPEARYCDRVGEVPLVFGDAGEITNRGIGRPGAAQRGPRQFGRYARL